MPSSDILWIEHALQAGEPFVVVTSGIDIATSNGYKLPDVLISAIRGIYKKFPRDLSEIEEVIKLQPRYAVA